MHVHVQARNLELVVRVSSTIEEVDHRGEIVEAVGTLVLLA